MAQSLTTSTQQSQSEDVLRTRLRVTPERAGHCAMATQQTDVRAVSQQLKADASDCSDNGTTPCGECHLELRHEDDEHDREYVKNTITNHCLCLVFEEHDCIPEVKGMKEGDLVVVVTVPERTELRSLIRALEAKGANVSVDWLINGTKQGMTTEIDVSTVTANQREALELAIEEGYYETPRNADLSDLAAEMKLSESAISQRLNAAETKLVKAFLDG